MVEVVREKPNAVDDSIVRLQIYLSRKDNRAIVGFFEQAFQSASREVTFVKSNYGTPIGQAYKDALAYAESRNIPYLWIDDPDGLYPSDGV